MENKIARPKRTTEPSADPETRRNIQTLHFLFQCQHVTHLGLGCWGIFSVLHITSARLSPYVLILDIALLSLLVYPILLYQIQTPASLQLLQITVLPTFLSDGHPNDSCNNRLSNTLTTTPKLGRFDFPYVKTKAEIIITLSAKIALGNAEGLQQ